MTSNGTTSWKRFLAAAACAGCLITGSAPVAKADFIQLGTYDNPTDAFNLCYFACVGRNLCTTYYIDYVVDMFGNRGWVCFAEILQVARPNQESAVGQTAK